MLYRPSFELEMTGASPVSGDVCRIIGKIYMRLAAGGEPIAVEPVNKVRILPVHVKQPR